MSDIHISLSRVDRWAIRRHDCPTCKRRTFFWGWFQEWYGWELTCLRCGDRWQDGCDGFERCERPFARGWRKDSIKRAKKHAREVIASDPARTRMARNA